MHPDDGAVRPPDLRKAPPCSLNAVVDLLHTGGDGLLARAKFWRPLDSSARWIDNPPPPARLDLFNIVINRPMLHGVVPINVVTVFKMKSPNSGNAIALFWFGNRLTI